MKNKFLYINNILLLLLFLIGFSPQAVSIVYATDASSVTSDFHNQLSSVLEEGSETPSELLNDIGESVTLMSDNLSKISSGLGGFALAASVAVIAIIGFKIMNSGKGNVFELIKQKKDLSNAIICVIFITAIPYFVGEVTNFQIPKELLSDVDSSYTGTSTIGDLNSSTKSGLVEYIKENKSKFEPDNEQNFDSTLSSVKDETNSKKGIGKMLYEGLLGVLASLTYAPIAFIAGFLGKIGFYPVSLDTTMYGSDIYTVFKSYLETAAPSTVANSVNGSVSAVAAGLGSLTVVLNVLYYIAKKFVSLSLELVCYYYGVMHLFNKDTDDVGKFLIRLAEGLIGMTLFPYLLEFLLDLDGILATSILRLTGDSLPGFALLAILPSMSSVNDGFTVLVLGICLGVLICAMAKTFFVRRIEISLLYVASPIFFLKHIMVPKDGTISILTKKITSAVFLTTVYAPVFAIISLMIKLGVKSESSMVYYMIIIGMLWMGKDVVASIVQVFAGSSASASDASKRFAAAQMAPANVAKKAGSYAAAFGAYQATKGAINGVQDIKEKGLKGAASDRFDKFKNNFKDKNGNPTVGSIAKGIGKTAYAASGAKFATTAAKSAFWEKYNKAGRKYDTDQLEAKAERDKAEAMERSVNSKVGVQNDKERQKEARKREELYNAVKGKYGEEAAAKAIEDYDDVVANKKSQKKMGIDSENSMNSVDKAFEDRDSLPDDLIKQYDEYKEVYDSFNNAKKLKSEIINKDVITPEDLNKLTAYDNIINNGYTYLKQNQTRMERLAGKAKEHSANVSLNNAFGALSAATATSQTFDGESGIKIKSHGDVVDSLKRLQSVDNLAPELQNQVNGFLANPDAISEQSLFKFTSGLLNDKTISDESKDTFINGAFSIDRNRVAANMKLHGSVAESNIDRGISSIATKFNAGQVQSKIESFGLNAKGNDGFAIAYSNTFNGVNPSAVELTSFVNGQVGKTIDADTAELFLSSAFNCTTQQAQTALKLDSTKSLLNVSSQGVKAITPQQVNNSIETFSNNLKSDNCTLTNRDVVTKLQDLSTVGRVHETDAIRTIAETFQVDKDTAKALFRNQTVENFDLSKNIDRSNTSSLKTILEGACYSKSTSENYSKIISGLDMSSMHTVQDVMSNINSACVANNLTTEDAQSIASLVFNNNSSILSNANELLNHVQTQDFKADMLSSDNSYNSIFTNLSQHGVVMKDNESNLTPHIVSQDSIKNTVKSSLVEGIKYRSSTNSSGNVASAQMTRIIENLQSKLQTAPSDKVDDYKEALRKAKETFNVMNDSTDVEAPQKVQSFLTEQSKLGLIEKTDLNTVAQLAFAFSKKQAQAQVKTMVDSGFVSNDSYRDQLLKFDVNSETAALEYIELISGDNSNDYHEVSSNMVDVIIDKTTQASLRNNLTGLKDTNNVNFNQVCGVVNPLMATKQYETTSEIKRKSDEKLKEAKVNVGSLESYGLDKNELLKVEREYQEYENRQQNNGNGGNGEKDDEYEQ